MLVFAVLSRFLGKADGAASKSMKVEWTRTGPYEKPTRYWCTLKVTVNGSVKVDNAFNSYDDVPASFTYSV